jgi:hypothetical protein
MLMVFHPTSSFDTYPTQRRTSPSLCLPRHSIPLTDYGDYQEDDGAVGTGPRLPDQAPTCLCQVRTMAEGAEFASVGPPLMIVQLSVSLFFQCYKC